MADEDTITKAHCNRCNGITRHLVLRCRRQKGQETEPNGQLGYWWVNTYEMLECCGCAGVTLRHETHEAGMPEPTVAFYPPPLSRPLPKWLSGKGWLHFIFREDDLVPLLEEVYAALQAGSHRLALMGARALVERVLNDKVGDQGGFAAKLKAMESKGLITRQHLEILEVAIDAGSAVTHRAYTPKEETLHQVMDIVENLIESAYVLDKSADALRKTVPPRNP